MYCKVLRLTVDTIRCEGHKVRSIAWWCSLASVVLGVVGLIVAATHPLRMAKEAGAEGYHATMDIADVKFALSVLGFLLNFADLLWQRSWPDMRAQFGKASDKHMLSSPHCNQLTQLSR